ncbi:aldolase [Metabacillus litoralis]|uniref:aldolase n=1 Tax=Metabacillus litoralis TaxID=152268 RepID=UPI00203AF6AF|nr:aldolase [Metabacillus litoralis]MCM3650408.1 aldolase [Metabacillus litoralis]
MSVTLKKMYYKAFGLCAMSEIPLPELLTINDSNTMVDIEIKMADLTKLWLDEVAPPQKFLSKNNLIMFKIQNVAIFSIRNGNEIIVSPFKDSDADVIRLYILGTCMGVLLLQRNVLPLHGSAVAIDGKAYAFIGDSGAGKSTLASAFLNKGYQLLTDDIVAITFSENNVPIVTPAYPQQKLWQESLSEFGMESSLYRPLLERETKYAVPVASQYINDPLPLGGVFELVKSDIENVELHHIVGLEQVKTLFNHTYRNFLIPLLEKREWHFSITANLLKSVDLYQLQRSTTQFTAHHLVSIILGTLNKEVLVNEHSRDIIRI